MTTKNRNRTVLPQIDVPSIAATPRSRLRRMRAAAIEVIECMRVLDRSGLNLVGEVLRGQGTFYELAHYPPEDVFDEDSQSQYYYHAHRGSRHEHGHFHTFLRAPGMPRGIAPVAHSGRRHWPTGNQALSHLVAISMDRHSHPVGLFTVNRWVTAETWYRSSDVIRMLDRFEIDHASPSWPVNRWITAMISLFRPQIEALIRHRDAVVRAWAAAHQAADAYEDRRLDITGYVPVDLRKQIAAVECALGKDPGERGP